MTIRLRRFVGAAIVPVAVVALWWVWSGSANSFYFPALKEILVNFRQTWLFSHVRSEIVPSLIRAAGGYALGTAGGILLGLLLGLRPMAWRAAMPIVEFVRSIPGTALIPVGILVFGIGDMMKIGVIGLACLFPVLLNTIDGVSGIDPTYLATSHVYGIGGLDRLRRVIFPAALPQVVAGMRTSVSLALVVMVVSEMLASYNGVGYTVLQAEREFSMPEMWSGIILLGILGFVLNALFSLVERRVLRWHHGAHGITQ